MIKLSRILPRRFTPGFALPTILVASVVMMIILVGAVTSIGSLRTSLHDRYYMQMANVAAESGYARVLSCLRDSQNVVTWSAANPLKPNTDCNGAPLTSCPVESTNPSCYVMINGRIRTSFSIGDYVVSNGSMRFSGGGVLTLHRSVDARAIEDTYRADLQANVSMGIRNAEYVSSGYLGVCAIFDGKSYCWGDNLYGQMGVGYVYSGRTTIPVRVVREEGALLGKRDKLITLGTESACAVTTDDEIYCWGRNDYGQAGVGNTNGSTTSGGSPVHTRPQRVHKPAQMQGLEVKDLVMGFRHVCALTGTDVWCWGHGGYGQLGASSTATRTIPVRVWHIGTSNNAARPVTSLASSNWSDTNCAIAGGESWCWGRNERGQMGDGMPNTPGGSYTNRTTPWRTPTSGSSSLNGKTLTKVVLTGGFGDVGPDMQRRGHVCVLDTSQRVHCWGSDQYGQVGRGFVPSNPWVSDRPYQVNTGLLNGKNIADVAVSYATTCVLTTANELYCWGYNDRGMVGDGTMGMSNASRPMPTAVIMQTPGLQGKTITSISAGANRNCALAEGTQYCWGVNTAGQLGDGTLINRPHPTEATVLRQYVPVLYY